MGRFSLPLLALWATRAFAQDVILSSSFGGGIGDTTLTSNCGSSFQDANATGIYKIQPNVAQLPQANQPDNNSGYTLPVEIGITVLEGGDNLTDSQIQASIWYSTAGANYSDDLGLGYDVCAFTIGQISTNTLLRAQTDTGNCVATFDQDCVSAFEEAASSYALGLIQNATPAPDSNLTANSLGTVCYDIAQTIQDNFPQECMKFMNESVGLTVAGFPLTDNTDSPLYNGCDLSNDDSSNTYNLLYTQNTQIPAGQELVYYSAFTWNVIAAMLTFMPVANIKAGQTISGAVSKMGCLRTDHINPGSTKPLVAPSPTPLGSGGLSGGAIAGIVVGVVVAVALIAGVGFWFWRKRGNARKPGTVEGDAGDHPPPTYTDAKEHQTPVTEVPADAGVKELSPDNEVRPELAAGKSAPLAELGAEGKPDLKRGNTQDPVELSADVPASNNER